MPSKTSRSHPSLRLASDLGTTFRAYDRGDITYKECLLLLMERIKVDHDSLKPTDPVAPGVVHHVPAKEGGSLSPSLPAMPIKGAGAPIPDQG